MALIDMNIRDDDSVGSLGDYNESPCIYLTDEQCKALGITSPPAAGTAMMITARAVAQSVTQSVDGDKDDPDIRMSLQLTHMEISGSPSSGGSLY